MKQSLTLLGLGAALLLSQVARADEIDWKKVDAALGKTATAADATTIFKPRPNDTTRAGVLDGWHDAVGRALQPSGTQQDDTAHKGEKR